MAGNPTGCMGLADYLGWKWRSKASIPIVCVPGCPVLPDNFMETLLYLLYQIAGLAPMIPLDEALRPTWLFGQTVHEGCDRGGCPNVGGICIGCTMPGFPDKFMPFMDEPPGGGSSFGCCRPLRQGDKRIARITNQLSTKNQSGGTLGLSCNGLSTEGPA